jgi:hypothetical protein
VRDLKVLRAVVSVVAGVRCKLPSTSPSPLLLLESKKTQARRGGPPAILPRLRTASFIATLAQVQLNHQRIAVVVFLSSRAFYRFRSRLLSFTRPT